MSMHVRASVVQSLTSIPFRMVVQSSETPPRTSTRAEQPPDGGKRGGTILSDGLPRDTSGEEGQERGDLHSNDAKSSSGKLVLDQLPFDEIQGNGEQVKIPAAIPTPRYSHRHANSLSR